MELTQIVTTDSKEEKWTDDLRELIHNQIHEIYEIWLWGSVNDSECGQRHTQHDGVLVSKNSIQIY